MRKVFLAFPDNEAAVRQEIENLSEQMQVVTPSVEFWLNPHAKYDPNSVTIYIPSVEACVSFDPTVMGDPHRYWGLLMHEYAHHLDHVWNNGDDHNPKHSAILIGLNLYLGLPLADVEMYELGYKPGWWKKGSRVAGISILSDFRVTTFKERIK